MDSTLIRLSSPSTLKRTLQFNTTSRIQTLNHHFIFSDFHFPSTNPYHIKLASTGTPNNNVVFDESGFESERLSLDAKARESMAETSMREIESDPKAWKWIIRKRIWDLMETRNFAQNPRPVHHRIPNFVGASAAANKMAELEAFRVAKCVKVNPDSPQKQVRFLTLCDGKKLLTPQPRLRTGFFSVLETSMLSQGTMSEACTSVGVAKYGRPIGLDEKIKVDLIVIGSVAVDPKTGARLGKGEGFAELEYGMLRYMGAIDDSTPVVTSVHECQLVDDIPIEKLLVHDVPVDIICTPTRIIFTNNTIPKPQGIYWDKLSPEKLGQIRILRDLKRRIEILREGLKRKLDADFLLVHQKSYLPRLDTSGDEY